jgi:hypothetical protein
MEQIWESSDIYSIAPGMPSCTQTLQLKEKPPRPPQKRRLEHAYMLQILTGIFHT